MANWNNVSIRPAFPTTNPKQTQTSKQITTAVDILMFYYKIYK